MMTRPEASAGTRPPVTREQGTAFRAARTDIASGIPSKFFCLHGSGTPHIPETILADDYYVRISRVERRVSKT
jgi:hypothetical protein